MFTIIKSRRDYAYFLLVVFGLFCVFFGCAQAPPKEVEVGEEKPAEVQAIRVVSEPSENKAMIEITASRPIPYGAFKLVQPLRIVMGVTAVPSEGLTGPSLPDEKIIKDIRVESTGKEPFSTCVIATLSRDVEYKVEGQEGIIRLALFPKEPLEEEPAPVGATNEEAIGATKPRVFFLPGKAKLNQVLGVDFFMLPQGRSRITVTTSEKAEYNVSPKDSLTVLLELKNATILPELTRYIDSSHFKGIVKKITPIKKTAKRGVDLEISLKEAAPYHLVQVEKEIRIDFNKTTVTPPVKKITQEKYAKALVPPEKAPPLPEKAPPAPEKAPPEKPEERKPPEVPPTPLKPKPKEAARMTLEFSNADIRNILKLIGEVSQLNIVWGPEVKGTVSMRLKDVPWDQALDIVLETNNLGMRVEGNIIWVTTRTKIKELEKEEADKRKAELDRIREEQDARKRTEALEKELEPLVTEYIPVDFAKAEEDIKPLIEKIKSERGSISVDKRTNTVIITDTASNIEKAKNIVREFDAPVKQIMIEARIVDASTGFSRDMGIQWTSINRQWQTRTSLGWESDPTAFAQSGDVFAGNFSTNIPTGWTPNIGVRFASLSSSGLGTVTLDASLALAETEDKARVISAPKVIASNGEQAVISRGDIIYKEVRTADTIAVEELPATLSLTVTPTVSFNNYVTMDIDVKDAKVYLDQSGKTEKAVKTKLMVKSGDTVVIGGIFKEDTSETDTGIPWLKDIPILGWFFGANTEGSSRSELLIFLTPTVIERGYKAEK